MDDFSGALRAQIPKLRAYALMLTRSSVDADDLVQETMLRAWRFRDQFQAGTNLPAWLFKILRNAFFNMLLQGRNTVRDVDEKFASRVATAPDQEWRVQYGEFVLALDKLPAAAREAILLVGAAGLTYDEAAVVCGCSVGTVKSRVNRARTRLVRLMDPDTANLSPFEAAASA